MKTHDLFALLSIVLGLVLAIALGTHASNLKQDRLTEKKGLWLSSYNEGGRLEPKLETFAAVSALLFAGIGVLLAWFGPLPETRFLANRAVLGLGFVVIVSSGGWLLLERVAHFFRM